MSLEKLYEYNTRVAQNWATGASMQKTEIQFMIGRDIINHDIKMFFDENRDIDDILNTMEQVISSLRAKKGSNLKKT